MLQLRKIQPELTQPHINNITAHAYTYAKTIYVVVLYIQNSIFFTGILKSFKHDPDVPYPMTHVPCGYAVIINNIVFDEGTRLETREGSEVDVAKMTKLFEWLQFKVEVHRNKKAAEIRSTVRHYCYGREHNKFDCFVLFLMSHGLDDAIFGTDGELVYLRSDIRPYLLGDTCYSLSGKPKLIFVQACRGREANEGLVVTESGYNLPSQEASPYPVCTPSNLDMTPSFTPATDFKYSIPQDSDVLIFYASSSSYAAHRNTREGGWFVKELYDVMRKYAKTEDLQSMITKVTGQTATRMMKKDKKKYMQCPEQVGNLRKQLFFNPRQRNLEYD